MQKIEEKSRNSHFNFLAKNVFWLTLGRVVSMIISLLALPIFTTYLAPEAFGVLALFTVESSLLAGLYGLGLNSFAGRMIYKYDRRNKRICKQYLGVTLFYLSLFSLLGFFISLPFAKFLKELILKDVFFPYPLLFYIPPINAFFLTLYGFTTNSFLNLQHNKKLFICIITETLLLIPLQIIGLVWFGFTWIEIVVLRLIITAIVTLLSLFLIRESLGFSFKRLRILKKALRYSLPYIPLNFLGWIQQQIDKVFLGRMQGMSHVGVYAIGVRVSGVFRLLFRPIVTTIKPEISKRLDGRVNNCQRDIRDFFNVFFQLSLFAIFAISIFSREIITLLTDVKYTNAFKVIPFIVFAYMFSEITGIFHVKFIYKNKSILFPVTIFLGAFLNASLNYYLIPKFDILGAAFATVLANLVLLFVCYFISQKLHFSKYDMMKNFATLIGIVLFIILIQNVLSYSILMIFIKFGLITCYGVILYKYLLHTNRRFQEMKDSLLTIVKRRFIQ